MFPFFFATLFFCTSGLWCADWVLAAEKFRYADGQPQDAVTEAVSVMFPQSILEKLSAGLSREILPDEQLERELYALRQERYSLYLQLVAEEKKRDSLVLYDYSASKLARKIREQEKEITGIKKKLDENLAGAQKAEADALAKRPAPHEPESGGPAGEPKFSSFVRKLFSTEDEAGSEHITFYKNSSTELYAAGETAAAEGYTSELFAKEITEKGVRTLLTGTVTAYGDYLMVTADAYLYPGARKIGTVTEVGSSRETEQIAASLARQLVPVITNAMPVRLKVELVPSGATFYIDDVLQKENISEMIVDSGVHTLQFSADGYETAGTSFYFHGNTEYQIQARLERLSDGKLFLALKKPLDGVFYANGLETARDGYGRSEITINGRPVLGEFITDSGEYAFYYIQEKLIADDIVLAVNAKPFSRGEYIDRRRRWMYASYSLLITSLIPSFYTYGNFSSYLNYYQQGFGTLEEAQGWQRATYVSIGISVACGVFFGYELVRYLLAANTVLPASARKAKNQELMRLVAEPEPGPDAETESQAETTDNEVK